jgi:magnesium chelatase accessory protein
VPAPDASPVNAPSVDGRGLDWARDGADWPHHEASRFIEAGGLTWHVQVMGSGPALLLLHGTGASSHSWRALATRLAPTHTLIVPDLPGHAFTRGATREHVSLPGMAAAVGDLLRVLDLAPELALGHSAGAAVLARMALDRRLQLRRLLGINAALLPLRGLPGQFYLPAARLMAATSLVPRLFSWRADAAAIDRLIRSTGSILDRRGAELYARLLRDPAHVGGALKMMANWDLAPLARDLPALPCPLTLLVASNDRTVRPEEAQRVRTLLPAAEVVDLPGLGHLAHEERPAAVAAEVERLG